QPYIVALMLEAAEIKASDRVLEVGAGSGYVIALLSRLAAFVHGIERHAELASAAMARLRKLEVRNADIQTGDGTLGLPSVAPFDAILVSAGSPDVPSCLKEQLAVGGRLVIPVGLAHNRQTLVRIIRRNDTEFDQAVISAVNFVPLVGRHGWSESDTCAV
ncbi:MAG TPA: methyltransferase domain-containing protein, partial [Herminiimonas sp.]|nr:methyltransferase domain-containing protein [Herminiimonas sp.]